MQRNCGLLRGSSFAFWLESQEEWGLGSWVAAVTPVAYLVPRCCLFFILFFLIFSTERSPPQGLFSSSRWHFGPGDSDEGLLHSAGCFPLLDDNRTLQRMTIKVLSLDIARCPGWWGTQGWKPRPLLLKVCVEMLANEVERGNAPKALDSLCEQASGVPLSRCLWSGERPPAFPDLALPLPCSVF